jgi:DNA invertase Pin-like site-specific DNA recombinase
MKRHVAFYPRVSTKSQDTKMQMPALESFAKRQTQPVIWYQEKFTGKTMDRPAWNKLQAAITADQVSAVVVWKLDRLGRTTLGLVKLFEDLQERGIKLISLTEGIDLSTPAGRKFARDLASAAEYEREVIGERIREGIAVAKASGKTWGGSKAGVRKKVTATQMKAIRRMKQDGEPITEIAKAVGLSRPTIYSVLEQ